MTKDFNELISPATARALIEALSPQDGASVLQADEDACLWWLIQREIMWGGITQAKEIVDEEAHARSRELSKMHQRACLHPEDTAAHERVIQLMAEITAAANLELAERKKLVATGQRNSIWDTGAYVNKTRSQP